MAKDPYTKWSPQDHEDEAKYQLGQGHHAEAEQHERMASEKQFSTKAGYEQKAAEYRKMGMGMHADLYKKLGEQKFARTPQVPALSGMTPLGLGKSCPLCNEPTMNLGAHMADNHEHEMAQRAKNPSDRVVAELKAQRLTEVGRALGYGAARGIPADSMTSGNARTEALRAEHHGVDFTSGPRGGQFHLSASGQKVYKRR